jgi:hypothetical protein
MFSAFIWLALFKNLIVKLAVQWQFLEENILGLNWKFTSF